MNAIPRAVYDTFVVEKRDERVRRCECCERPLRKRVRADRKTCSKSCRQKLSRRRNKLVKVSRADRAKRLLSECARRRALEGVSID